LSCHSAPPVPAEAAPSGLVATVNGQRLTADDLRAAASREGHDDAPSAPTRAVLDTLVRQEIASQEAKRLGLDTDPQYLDKVRSKEAELRAFERKQLAELYWKHNERETTYTEADARSWYDANQARIGTDVHVMQILSRDRAKLDAERAEIVGGAKL